MNTYCETKYRVTRDEHLRGLAVQCSSADWAYRRCMGALDSAPCFLPQAPHQKLSQASLPFLLLFMGTHGRRWVWEEVGHRNWGTHATPVGQIY